MPEVDETLLIPRGMPKTETEFNAALETLLRESAASVQEVGEA